MKAFISTDFKLGILGGGQLGKMLLAETMLWDIHTCVLDPDPSCPSSTVCTEFYIGDFNDYQTVLDFGRKVNLLTIEIEHVNLDALFQLQKEGIIVNPNPQALKIVKDKGLQKDFYKNAGFPTSNYKFYASAQAILDDLKSQQLTYPFVQKSRKDGYDGKGVAVINNAEELHKLLDAESIVEEKIEIAKEISVVVARNSKNQIKAFPTVEMVFNSDANLVDYLFSPAKISADTENKAIKLAVQIVEKLEICGLLAVEMFLTANEKLLINEVAPRPHNSGHHTIEAAITSQYQQHLRAILGLELGDTRLTQAAAMLNLLGEPENLGEVDYQGVQETLSIPGAYLHIYGKKFTKPFRKMGHITIVGNTLDTVLPHISYVKKTLKAKAK